MVASPSQVSIALTIGVGFGEPPTRGSRRCAGQVPGVARPAAAEDSDRWMGLPGTVTCECRSQEPSTSGGPPVAGPAAPGRSFARARRERRLCRACRAGRRPSCPRRPPTIRRIERVHDAPGVRCWWQNADRVRARRRRGAARTASRDADWRRRRLRPRRQAGYGSYGASDGCALPSRPGLSPVAATMPAGRPSTETAESSNARSRYWPLPVCWRLMCASRMPCTV